MCFTHTHTHTDTQWHQLDCRVWKVLTLWRFLDLLPWWSYLWLFLQFIQPLLQWRGRGSWDTSSLAALRLGNFIPSPMSLFLNLIFGLFWSTFSNWSFGLLLIWMSFVLFSDFVFSLASLPFSYSDVFRGYNLYWIIIPPISILILLLVFGRLN